MAAEENILVPATRRAAGLWTLDALYELFPMVAARRTHRAALLSGGEQQAVAIARALAANPRVLLLDEVSLGLAPAIVDAFYQMLPTIQACGMAALGVPLWAAMLIMVPLAFGLGMVLQLGLFGRALRTGPTAPLLVTFGLSVMIENLLQQIYSANTRGVGAGNLDVAAVHIGALVLPWLAMLKLVLALVVIGGLSALLWFTAWGRRVRATSDDLAVARLQGIRVRPLFASVTGIAIAAAALAGTLNAVTTGVYPTLGALTLIFAFEAVIIGGLGSLWGTLLGGMLLGTPQAAG